MRRLFLFLFLLGFCLDSALAEDRPASVEWGRHIAIIAGCHDCHSAGYVESGGAVDPATALTGGSVGFRGPWGTTYATNLRILAAGMSEDEWFEHLKTLQARPPMPFFNLHEMEERDLRSLHRYVRSLGDPGKPAPDYVPPGVEPLTPFIVFSPPTMPKG